MIDDPFLVATGYLQYRISLHNKVESPAWGHPKDLQILKKTEK